MPSAPPSVRAATLRLGSILPGSQLAAECPVLQGREQLVLEDQCPLDPLPLCVDLRDDGRELALDGEGNIGEAEGECSLDVQVTDVGGLVAETAHRLLDPVTVEPVVEEHGVHARPRAERRNESTDRRPLRKLSDKAALAHQVVAVGTRDQGVPRTKVFAFILDEIRRNSNHIRQIKVPLNVLRPHDGNTLIRHISRLEGDPSNECSNVPKDGARGSLRDDFRKPGAHKNVQGIHLCTTTRPLPVSPVQDLRHLLLIAKVWQGNFY
ncbi:conserved hypothetical protein [Micrococcus luteus]|nr:conserved hypothetical protein [Micrococcus luteus]